MKLYLLGIILLSFCTSCALLPDRGNPLAETVDPELTKFGQAHKTFLEQPTYKSLIYRNDELIPELNPDNARLEISLSAMRAHVLLGDEVVIDTPVSSGRKTHPTPTGSFKIIGKNKDHRSNIYGTIYNSEGGYVAGGDRRKNEVPQGGKFVGTAMPYWMRLTNTGVGLHVGHVPTYPASHGCIRLPKRIAPIIYEKTRVGTPVTVSE